MLWLKILLSFLIISLSIAIICLGIRLKPIPKSKKKQEEIKMYDIKLLVAMGVCFICVVIAGNILANFTYKEIPKEVLKEYQKVDRYSYQEGSVVYEVTKDNLYTKDGKLYEITAEGKVGNNDVNITEIPLPEDKLPRIYVPSTE